MEISVAIITFIILFCLYLAVVTSGNLDKHKGPIRIGDAGYDPDKPNHS